MVDIERHAEAVLRALLDDTKLPPMKEHIRVKYLAALTALADEAAGEMREEIESQADWTSEDGRELGVSLKVVRAIPLPSERN